MLRCNMVFSEAGVNIRKEIVDKAYYVFPVFPVSHSYIQSIS